MPFKRFVAIDGEAVTDDTGHYYVLLAASTGKTRWENDGLSTTQCFDFLLKLRQEKKSYIFVAFGLNYDVNMWLRDFGEGTLRRLWKQHRVKWYSYTIEWIPGKWFSVRKGKTTVRIHEVFGFFQTSFVNSLRKWDIPVPGEVETMKQLRSEFSDDDRERITQYCLDECDALVTLMKALQKALRDVDLVPASWIGAGAIAARLLSRREVTQHHVYDSDFPDEVCNGILRSYFGGRVELFQQGHFATLMDYDIRSAYPTKALSLPSLVDGHWRHTQDFEPNSPHGIYRVKWKLDDSYPIMPFPFRMKKEIFYPSNGHGWYQAVEVSRALKIHPSIEIHEGWIFEPATDYKPFHFIREDFKHRAKLKAAGHPGEKVLKLGLNAMYGKCAQGSGFRGKPPRFQSYFWAGYMTAATRAQMLSAAEQAPESIVMIATDGIFFTAPFPDIECSDGLGGWDVAEMQDVFVAQAGVYQATVDGETIAKSRGFFSREIDFDQLRAGYDDEGVYFVAEYDSTRFVGLGSALMMRDRSSWRTWRTSQRKLSLYPSRKFPLDDTATPTRVVAPSVPRGRLSDIYVPKDGSMEWAKKAMDFVEGMEQPRMEAS